MEEEIIEYKIEDAEKNSDNKEFMQKAIKDDATWVLVYASEKLHRDKELMLEGIKKDGQLLYYASQELRDDKEIVLTAVTNKWLILKYASYRMRSDKDIAIVAIKQNINATNYLTKEILKDKEIQELIKEKKENE